jgi:hypothetical protein
MAIKVIEATPQVIETLQKAQILVQQSKESGQKMQNAVQKSQIEIYSEGKLLVPAKVISGDSIQRIFV